MKPVEKDSKFMTAKLILLYCDAVKIYVIILVMNKRQNEKKYKGNYRVDIDIGNYRIDIDIREIESLSQNMRREELF